MQTYNISTELKFVNQIGQTLSTEERLNLEMALIKLSETEKADEILFWGKIEGTQKNYYIAMSLIFRDINQFPIKKFHFTNSDFNTFSTIPEINQKFIHQLFNYRLFFTGQHDNVIFDSCTELDRLAYVVRCIENDCQSVPLGAFKLTPSKELRYNENYRGLNLKDAQNLQNYLHFKSPQSEEKQVILLRDDSIYRYDFLESLQDDQPKGQWSIQSDSSKLNISLRSLLWPGYIAYNRVNSNIFGAIYMGNGICNTDLQFILA